MMSYVGQPTVNYTWGLSRWGGVGGASLQHPTPAKTRQLIVVEAGETTLNSLATVRLRFYLALTLSVAYGSLISVLVVVSDAMVLNPGCNLDLSWVESLYVNANEVNRCAQKIPTLFSFKNESRMAWLLRAVSCIDLTTLGGDDSESNVQSLCRKAINPLEESLRFVKTSTAAVCVYPNWVKTAVETLHKCGRDDIPVASVATGFPSGQYPLHTRLEEIRFAVSCGAREIDVVINRSLVIRQNWTELYHEIKEMKKACGDAHLKVILAVGELGRYINVLRASMVLMMAGADFIKTSTGKEAVNATIPVGIVMCRAIKEYYRRTGFMVGLKPAGGIKTTNQTLDWLVLVSLYLGKDWLNSKYFRIGASGLLAEIEKELYFLVHKCVPSPTIFTIT